MATATAPPKTQASPSSTASATLDDFREFCKQALTVNEGGPLLVEPFQETMLSDYFGGTRSTVILISKKNGKTSLLGALALFHLLTVEDAECVIAAASRDQAAIMLRQIRGFIRRNRELAEILEVTQRVISCEETGGQIRILASDVDTVDGAIPTLVLIDELHRHKNPDVYGVLRDGLGPRDGRMVTISTAGDDENSPLGVLRQKAYQASGMKRDGAYRYVRTRDFCLHEWALDPEDNRDDLEVVKTANPASWQTIEELRRRKEDPSMMAWQWARFACGVWMAGEESAISEKEWRACAGAEEIPPGTVGVLVGVDLAQKWDTTAFVPVAKLEDKAVVGKPSILTPPQDGTSLPYEEVWAVAQQMADKYPGCRFVFDPTRGGEQLFQQIEGEIEGVEAIVHSQDPRPMALAAERLVGAISERKIAHPDDPELNAHVLSAAAYFVGDRWKFVKQKRKKMPIDGVIALAMAHSVLIDGPDSGQSVAYFL
jgi:phage terminase large subunit-like protein